MRTTDSSRAFALAVALLAAVLGASALLRPALVGNDAFGYLDVARNVANGEGIVQRAVGFNAAELPADAAGPAPYTAQAPAFPLLVALAVRSGLPPIPALLLVQALALLALFPLAHRIASAAWGGAAGWLAAGLCATPVLFPGFLHRGWSELPALAFALASLAIDSDAESAETRPGARLGAAFASGLAAGASFGVRYAFAGGGVIGVLRRLWGPRRDFRAAALFALGWLTVAGPVMLRNVRITGHPLGAPHAVYPLSLERVLAEAIEALAGHRLGGLAVLAGLAAAALAALAVRREGSWRAAWSALSGRGPAAMALWAALSLALVVAARTRVGFDAIGLRLLVPTLVTLLFYGVGLLTVALRPDVRVARRSAALLVAACALLAAVSEWRLGTVPDDATRIEVTPVLAWIRDHSRPDDLLVAENGANLPYYFRQPSGSPRLVVCVASPPYMRAFHAEDLAGLAAQHHATNPRARTWLIVYRHADAGAEGEEPGLLVRLARGAAPGPGLLLEAELADVRVYRVDPLGGGTSPGLQPRPDS